MTKDVVLSALLGRGIVVHESSTQALDDELLVATGCSPEINELTSIRNREIVTVASVSSSGDFEEVDLSSMTGFDISSTDWSLSDLPFLSSTIIISQPEIDTVAPSARWNTQHRV